MTVTVSVKMDINNLPEKETISQYPYMIITFCGGEYWYYGADYDFERSNAIAKNLNKIVINNPFYQPC